MEEGLEEELEGFLETTSRSPVSLLLCCFPCPCQEQTLRELLDAHRVGHAAAPPTVRGRAPRCDRSQHGGVTLCPPRCLGSSTRSPGASDRENQSHVPNVPPSAKYRPTASSAGARRARASPGARGKEESQNFAAGISITTTESLSPSHAPAPRCPPRGRTLKSQDRSPISGGRDPLRGQRPPAWAAEPPPTHTD